MATAICHDELRWAAAELYLATRARTASSSPPTPAARRRSTVPSWSSVGTLGVYSLVDHRRELPRGFDGAALVGRLRTLARTLAARARSVAYGVAMTRATSSGGQQRRRGEPGRGARPGSTASRGDTTCLRAARRELSTTCWAAIRRATRSSPASARGRRCTRTTGPRRRTPSPRRCRARSSAGRTPASRTAARATHRRSRRCSYVDAQCCYASNEIAINWNAPMAYLAAAIDATDRR